MKWRACLTAFGLLILVAGGASADQTDPRLDKLFAEIKATGDDEAAARIDREIWSIWLTSGDEDIDRIMQQGAIAMTSQVWPVALTSFNFVVEQHPEFAEGWNKRATLYYLMERYDESMMDVEKTLALEPRHYGALSGAGLIELQRQNLPEALEWFRKALAVNPHLSIRDLADQLETKVKGKPI